MSDSQWVPFSKRGDAVATAEFLEFIPGLDGRRKTLVVKWLIKRGGVVGYPYDRTTCGLMERFIDAAAPDLDATRAINKTTTEWAEFFAGMGEQSLIDFFDYALHEIEVGSVCRGYAREIEKSLQNAHSIYGVGERDGRYCVIERVDPTVQAVVKDAVDESGSAGQSLGKAWGQAYAVHPDPTGAYGNAVRAVETLLCPMVEPDAPKPTLGTSIRVLRDQHSSPKSTWTFKIDSKLDPEQPVRDVVSMMTILWNGQMDRHGGDETKTRPVTLEEARAAVLLAATLVGWLKADYLVKIK